MAVARISTDGEFLFQKRLSLSVFFSLASYFLPAKAMQNNIRELKNLFSLICGFRIPDSGFRIPVSGFRFLVSGFRFPIPVSRF